MLVVNHNHKHVSLLAFNSLTSLGLVPLIVAIRPANFTVTGRASESVR